MTALPELYKLPKKLIKQFLLSTRNEGGSYDILHLYLDYRLIFSLGLMFLFLSNWGPAILGKFDPELFTTTSLLFVILAASSLVLNHYSITDRDTEFLFALLTDCAIITFLMHSSGGVKSGLGMLLGLSIAFGSLGTSGRSALLFAALGTMAIMTENIYSDISNIFPATAYTQSGLLGMSFFALAFITQQLSARAAESEKLARQRGADLANMAELNDYIIQHMRTGIVVVDNQEIIRLMNQSAWYLLGMPDATKGHPLEHASPELAGRLRHWRSRPDKELSAFKIESGSPEVRTQFTRLGKGGIQGMLIFLEDTAQVIEHAQQIKLASLGRLTASIAHEIRNPLGAISHAAQLLEESPDLAGTDKRMADIITGNSARLNEVIENVLSLSRRTSPTPETVILGDWVGEAVAEMAANLNLSANQVSSHVEPEDTRVHVDPKHLSHVVTTLFENAVSHFNGDGKNLSIQLIAGITRDSRGPFLEVRDNGPGITDKVAGQIFEPFFTTRNEGTGLGLYIAKELCDANMIRLDYLSLPNGGSCFRLSFSERAGRENDS